MPDGDPIPLNSEVKGLTSDSNARFLAITFENRVEVYDVTTRLPVGPGIQDSEKVFSAVFTECEVDN